jgi:hypothetical protein
MEQELSIRKCAKQVGISVPTAFMWRHKILHALAEDKNQSLGGVDNMRRFALEKSALIARK